MGPIRCMCEMNIAAFDANTKLELPSVVIQDMQKNAGRELFSKLVTVIMSNERMKIMNSISTSRKIMYKPLTFSLFTILHTIGGR